MIQRVGVWYSAEFRGKALTRAHISQDKTRTAVAKTTLPQRGAKQRKGTGERGEATGRKRIREKAKSRTRASQEPPPISDSPTSRFLNTGEIGGNGGAVWRPGAVGPPKKSGKSEESRLTRQRPSVTSGSWIEGNAKQRDESGGKKRRRGRGCGGKRRQHGAGSRRARV